MPGPVLGGLYLGAEIVTPKLVLPVGAVGHAPTCSLAGAPRQFPGCLDKQEEIDLMCSLYFSLEVCG